MDLKDIMSVSGQGGLFKFISQGRNGIIVEALADKKRNFISASQKVSSLGDISIFTDGEEVPLQEVMKIIFKLQPGVPVPDPKSSPDVLKKFMENVLPNYDRERVYVSDIKKLVSWYSTLLEHNLLSFEEEAAPEAATKTEEPIQEEGKSKTASKPSGTKVRKFTSAKKAAAAKK